MAMSLKKLIQGSICATSFMINIQALLEKLTKIKNRINVNALKMCAVRLFTILRKLSKTITVEQVYADTAMKHTTSTCSFNIFTLNI